MSYTPTTWNTGDTVTASAMNKIENGIANAGGSSWDAVIRLTHSNDSGADVPAHLTTSIVSGTFADLSAKLSNGGFPCILVEYYHLMFSIRFSAIMGYVDYFSSTAIGILIAGFSPIGDSYKTFGRIIWDNNNTIVWD